METNQLILLGAIVLIIYYFFFRKNEGFSDEQSKEIQDAFKIKYPYVKYSALECLNAGKIYLPDGSCLTNDEARRMML
jgi:hypothetical protein